VLDRKSFERGWALLNHHERKQALGILLLGILVALTSVMLVGSIFPFLTVLMEPNAVHSQDFLSFVYEYFDFLHNA